MNQTSAESQSRSKNPFERKSQSQSKNLKLKSKIRLIPLIQQPEQIAFIIVFMIMAVYYGWRMVTIAPWYDELYTFRNFIEPGPLYAATHWPLPNNHVFFSVVSGIVNLFGNNLIGLRGISYLAALFTLYLIYKFANKFVSKSASLIIIVLYGAMYNIATLSTQGRGYSLSCLLCILTCSGLFHLCMEDKPKKRYTLLYIAGLSLGLYTVPSNLYWVFPVCIAGGIFLLVNRKWKALGILIIKSVVAAVCSLLCYVPIWLVTGSNILGLEEGGKFFGKGRMEIFLQAPVLTIQKGIEFMLSDTNVTAKATPLQMIQSMQYIIRDYFGNVYLNQGERMKWIVAGAFILLVIRLVVSIVHKNKKDQFIIILTVGMLCLVPFMLVVQCVVPYVRVYAPLSIPLCLALGVALDTLFWGKLKKTGLSICFLIGLVFYGYNITSAPYNYGYESRDNSLDNLFASQNWDDVETIIWGDTYVELQGYYQIESVENREIEVNGQEPDCIIIDIDTMNGLTTAGWPYFYLYQDLPWDYINQNMEITYQDDIYVCYRKITP